MTDTTTPLVTGKGTKGAVSAGGNPIRGGMDTVPEGVKQVLPAGAFMTSDHRYYFNGEGPNPSVTTVLGIMEKPAVMVWKAKETARAILSDPDAYIVAKDDPTYLSGMEDRIRLAVAESDKARDTAAKLGSGIHLLADMAARGDESQSEGFQLSEQEKPYLEAFRSFLGRYSASSIVSSEKAVWSLNGYAGTYDLLMQLPSESLQCSCQWEDGGWPDLPQNAHAAGCTCLGLWLIDIKTSKGFYPEYGLQLAAYRWADSIIVPGNPTPYPMPLIQRTGVLHLRPDAYKDTGWRLIEYPTTYEDDYLAFLGLLEAYNWKQKGRFTKSQLQKR